MTADEVTVSLASEGDGFAGTQWHGLINALTVVDLRLQVLGRTGTRRQRNLVDDLRRSVQHACDVVQEVARTWPCPAQREGPQFGGEYDNAEGGR